MNSDSKTILQYIFVRRRFTIGDLTVIAAGANLMATGHILAAIICALAGGIALALCEYWAES